MFDDVTNDVILPLGWGGAIFLAENVSHIYPNMCAKFGCDPTVMSKKRGVQTDRQTDKGKLQLYGYVSKKVSFWLFKIFEIQKGRTFSFNYILRLCTIVVNIAIS